MKSLGLPEPQKYVGLTLGVRGCEFTYFWGPGRGVGLGAKDLGFRLRSVGFRLEVVRH